MNTTNAYKTLILLSLLLGVLITGCQVEEPDTPPENLPGETMDIATLREMFTGQTIRFSDNVSVFGVVTMDESSGNIYRNIFVEDETGGINVRLDFASNIRQGDYVRLSLKGTLLGSYANMLQLDSLQFGKNLIIQESGRSHEPITATIPEILAGGLQARVVKLHDVQFATGEIGKRFANVAQGINENRDLTDCNGNRIIVRTSAFANFANALVPEGNGSLVAAVSQFNNTWQLLIRNIEELDMTGERCDTGDPKGSGTFEDPYNVAHAIAFNSGTNRWVEGYIVGVMETNTSPFVASYSPPFFTNSNLIIADKADETSVANALIVQLPIGQIRDILNLVNTPQNRGKLVKIRGDLSAYFSQPGMRNANGYWMDGQGIGIGNGGWDNLTPMTIAQVRQLHQGSNVNIPANRMIQGVVISDRSGENITNRNLVIADENDGTGIVLRFASAHSFALGARIRINVSGIEVSRFNGLLQVSEIPNDKAELLGTGTLPAPEQTTIAAVLANMNHFESRLIRLSNVSISGGNTWNGNNGNLTLNDGTGTITHYTTSYSAFRNQSLPAGQVSLRVIVSVYNSPQVSIRNLSDIQ